MAILAGKLFHCLIVLGLGVVLSLYFDWGELIRAGHENREGKNEDP